MTSPDWPAWVQAVGSIAAIIAAAFIAGFQHWADRRREREREAARRANEELRESLQRRKLRIQMFPVLVRIRAHLATLEANTRQAHADMVIDDTRLNLLKVPHIERLTDFVDGAALLPATVMPDFLNLLEWGRLYNDMVGLVTTRSSDGKGWVVNVLAVGDAHIQHIRTLVALCEGLFLWAYRETYGPAAVPWPHVGGVPITASGSTPPPPP